MVSTLEPCRLWTRGFNVDEQHVEWTTLETFDAVNGTAKQTSVTWSVSRSHTRSYEVSGEVGVDSLFDFLKVNVSGKIMRKLDLHRRREPRGDDAAPLPRPRRAPGRYPARLRSEWICDLQGRRQRTPYAATAPAGRRFVRTS